MKVTNYILKSNQVDFIERFILPDSRGRMNELISIMEERGYEPLQPIGKDGCWWIDDLQFYTDRAFLDCEMGEGFCKFLDDLEDKPLKEGETRNYEYDGNVMTVIADCSDLSKDGLITNDCQPVGLDTVEGDDSEDLLVRAEKFADTIRNTSPTTNYDQQKRDINTFEVIQELIEKIRTMRMEMCHMDGRLNSAGNEIVSLRAENESLKNLIKSNN